MVDKKLVGNVGCSMSHLRLLEFFVDNSHLEDIFVFEDDRKIHEHSHQQGDFMSVEIPANADVAFLMRSFTKTVQVPVPGEDSDAIQIIAGYGACGYAMSKVARV
jgi:GR25 family glycosyltransferase involved in LPS biosynthesis